MFRNKGMDSGSDKEKYARQTAKACPGLYNPMKLVRTCIVAWNKDWCFQVKLYNGYHAELHNINGSNAFNTVFALHKELGSSGSIVSDYGLDDRVIGVRSPAGAKDISSILCVQTGSGAHPASCPMVPNGPFPGAKARPGRDADHSPPSSAEVENE
jgi:hypothetical protein